MKWKLFVSFSEQDALSVGKLLSALRKQNLTVWDYTLEGDRIGHGEVILEACKRQIGSADYFLAFVSVHTCCDSWTYAQEETSYAVMLRDRGEKPIIVPVVDISMPVPRLSGPYVHLAGILRLEFDGRSQLSADEAVRRLCTETLQVDYIPQFKIDPRIRLIQQFRGEYRAFETAEVSADSARNLPKPDYHRLDRLMEEFSEEASQSDPDWQEALTIVSEALRIIRKNKIENNFYFPLVMRGICEYELGDYSSAKRTFNRASEHPRADGHAISGLALICWSQHEYASALELLGTAAAQYGDAVPWEIRFNMICIALANEGQISVDPDLLKVNPDLLEVDDWVKYKTLLGAYYVKSGQYLKAREELSPVIERRVEGNSVATESALSWYAECLMKLGQGRRAVRMLVDEADSRGDGELYYRAAHLCIELNDLEKSAWIYEILCSNEKFNKLKYYLGYARVLYHLGRHEDMRAVCWKLLSRARNLTTITPEDHFNIGFAHYLLCDFDRARYEHEMAGKGFLNISYSDL